MYGSFAINYVYLSDKASVTQYYMSFHNKLPGEKKSSKYHACIFNLLLLIGKQHGNEKSILIFGIQKFKKRHKASNLQYIICLFQDIGVEGEAKEKLSVDLICGKCDIT